MDRLLKYIGLSVLVGAIVGCGGGGGGSSATASLTYRSDWSHPTPEGRIPTTQRVRLYQADGTLVSEQVLTSPTQTTVSFPSSPNVSYVIKADLFDGARADGTPVASLQQDVNPTGATEIRSVVGQPVTSISITPSAPSVGLGESKELHVSAVTQDQRIAFVSPNNITWTSDSASVATVDPNGLASGLTNGTSTIRATYTPSGLTASTSLQVGTGGITRGKWTVMVYLNAANSLYPYALPNIDQLERVAGGKDVRFIVEWKQVKGLGGNNDAAFSGTRRYLLQHDTNRGIHSTLIQDLGAGVDMADPSTLSDFIDWSKQNYPADHYAMVIWNHGTGWEVAHSRSAPTRAVNFDDETGNAMNIWQLGQALSGRHLDILAFDACLMQMFEVADELAGSADYIAGSEELTPAPGYPYDQVFKTFVDNPDASPRALSQSFVTSFISNYSRGDYSGKPLCQSVIETAQLSNVSQAVDTLGDALLRNSSHASGLAQSIRNSSTKYYAESNFSFYDLSDVASKMKTLSSVPEIQDAAGAVTNAVNNCVVWNATNSRSSQSHGISIEFSSSSRFPSADYANLKASQTKWSQFLRSPAANP